MTFLDGSTPLGTVALPDSPTGPSQSVGFSQQSSTDYVDVPASPSLNSLTDGANTQLTLTAWIYPTADMDNDGILYKGPFDNSQGTILIGFAHGVGQPNELNFRLNGAVGGPGEVTSNTYIPDDRWTFVSFTYNGSEEDIYINGVLDASASYSSPLQDDASDLYVGTYYSPTVSYDGHYLTFQGSIDEVGIWKEALTSTTIAGLYNGGLGVYGNTSASPWNSNLIASYHFDEGSGTTVQDYSPNGNNGNLEADATWQAGMNLPNVVSFTTSDLSLGENTITAVYSGDANYAPGTSAPIEQTVVVAPTVEVTPAEQSTGENGSAAEVTIFLESGPASQSVTVDFTLSGCANPSDYQLSASGYQFWQSGSSGWVTIPAGASQATVTIQSLTEPSGSEQVTLDVQSAGDGSYQVDENNSAATVTIVDDEPVVVAPTVEVTPDTQSTSENGSAAAVTISLESGAASQPVTVDFTLSGSANSGDFQISDGGSYGSELRLLGQLGLRRRLRLRDDPARRQRGHDYHRLLDRARRQRVGDPRLAVGFGRQLPDRRQPQPGYGDNRR